MAICITGGSSGIGRAIAERFATPGNDVFVNYHANDDAAAATAAAIEAGGATPHLLKVDISTSAGAAELLGLVAERTARLDQLVHASAATERGPLLELDPERLEAALTLNATALVHLVREARPLLVEGSTVFYVTSRGGRVVIPGYGSLGAAKALGDHLARYLAVELAPSGIRVNSISPGPVDTAAYRAMFPDDWAERLDAAAAANPTGRGLEKAEIAEVVATLARPEFAMVLGQTIAIDGGFSL
ncbi:MAG: SDR family oxidoreductase [Actinobacteria bacterium]|nr:SDR family oxidoreductase [Actinomycetota bacterium]